MHVDRGTQIRCEMVETNENRACGSQIDYLNFFPLLLQNQCSLFGLI